jgi:hypothetical protein
MYEKWLEWLTDINTDCTCDCLRRRRKEKKIEIYHQKYILTREELILSRIRADLYKMQREYEEIDLELALIDGRFTHCPTPKPSKKKRRIPKEDKILQKLKTLNTADRERLLSELIRLEKEE